MEVRVLSGPRVGGQQIGRPAAAKGNLEPGAPQAAKADNVSLVKWYYDTLPTCSRQFDSGMTLFQVAPVIAVKSSE